MQYRSLLVVLASACVVSACSSSKVLTLSDMEMPEVVIKVDEPLKVERSEAIDYYRSLVEQPVDDRYRARAMKRLADLELEQVTQKEGQSDTPLTPEEIAEYKHSINTYQELLSSYPSFQGNDQVLYQLARAYQRLGMLAESQQALTRIVSEYPDSAFIDEVQFRRGEYFFVDVDYEKSAAAYESVVQYGATSRFYEQALYKHGWNLLKLDRYDEALVSLLTLLDLKLEPLRLGETVEVEFPFDDAEKELVEDTLYATALVFSYINLPDQIDKTLSKRGYKNYDHLIYKALADLFLEQDRLNLAVAVHANYAVHYGGKPQAAYFKLRNIELFKEAGMKNKMLAAKSHFVKVYAPNTLYWLNYSDDARDTLIPHVRTQTLALTQHYHAIAQKDKSEANYQVAEEWYRFYLKTMPNDRETPTVHFLFADLQYERGKYDSAAEEYEKIAYEYENHPQGRDAGYAAILAHREHMKGLDESEQKKWRNKQVASLLRYGERYPNDSRIAKALATFAEESFEGRDYRKAHLLALQVVEMGDAIDPALVETGWRVLAHVAFEEQEYAIAEHAYQTLMKITMRKGDLDVQLMDWLAASIYKQGEQKYAEGRRAEAVHDYLRINVSAPNTDNIKTVIPDLFRAHSGFLIIKGAMVAQSTGAVDRVEGLTSRRFNKLAVRRLGHTR